jgi:1-aminocyclopropane-1-carboxylate deaminase/D-cysteine desulfhydrase-like pyridoxal-dependent ACC family enzyme
MAKIQKVKRVKVGPEDFAYAEPGDLTPVEQRGKIWLKRDDLYRAAGAPGGKVRTCWALAQDAKGLVAASHRHSPQMHMVARVANVLGIPCHIHTATGAETSEIEDAKSYGAKIFRHAPGYNGVLIARARADAASRKGWREIPFGMESQDAVDLTAGQVGNIPKGAKRLVIAVGIGMSLSGVLWGLKKAKRNLPVLAVAVGTPKPEKFIDKWAPEDWRETTTLIRAEEDYSTHVHAEVDGVLLDPVYESKTVKFLKPGDLLWVIGIRASALKK